MKTVTYLGYFCQHRFRSITRKLLKESQPILLHILCKKPRCVFSY